LGIINLHQLNVAAFCFLGLAGIERKLEVSYDNLGNSDKTLYGHYTEDERRIQLNFLYSKGIRNLGKAINGFR